MSQATFYDKWKIFTQAHAEAASRQPIVDQPELPLAPAALDNNDNGGVVDGAVELQQQPPQDLVDDAIANLAAMPNADQQQQQQQQQPQQQHQPSQGVVSIDAATSALLKSTRPIGRAPTFDGALLEQLRSRVKLLFDSYHTLSDEQVAHEALDIILQSDLSDDEKRLKLQHVYQFVVTLVLGFQIVLLKSVEDEIY